MGIDPAPFWANLFLYFHEDQFMTHLINSDKVKARHFHSIKRFIDNLCTIHDGGEFGRIHKNIYPKELDLKEEHSSTHATFLNLDINIVDWKFIYKLFDKRDSFPFFIVKMPYISSNIPKTIFYSALIGEILRKARSTLLFRDFFPKAKEFIKRMNSQGAEKACCYSSLKKLVNKHKENFLKYGVNSDTLLNKILSI